MEFGSGKGGVLIVHQVGMQGHCILGIILPVIIEDMQDIRMDGCPEYPFIAALLENMLKKAVLVVDQRLRFPALVLTHHICQFLDLVKKLTEACSFIAPITFYPGEFEMEAMAAGAVRVLNGEEELKVYSGKPIWDGFEWDE